MVEGSGQSWRGGAECLGAPDFRQALLLSHLPCPGTGPSTLLLLTVTATQLQVGEGTVLQLAPPC